MLWNRRSGSFCRQRRISFSKSWGSPVTSALGARGGSRATAASVSSVVAPENGRRPVTISYSSAPKLKTSLRASTFWPVACSGDM
jgi:hypothetical protein